MSCGQSFLEGGGSRGDKIPLGEFFILEGRGGGARWSTDIVIDFKWDINT